MAIPRDFHHPYESAGRKVVDAIEDHDVTDDHFPCISGRKPGVMRDNFMPFAHWRTIADKRTAQGAAERAAKAHGMPMSNASAHLMADFVNIGTLLFAKAIYGKYFTVPCPILRRH